MLKRVFIIISIFCYGYSLAQFHGIAGSAGTNAIHADSSVFVAWAKSCKITRGYQDISNTPLGYASVGDSTFALGKADASVVSLGDAGVAIVTFSAPVTNGPGYDFAVFENSFNHTFLELAFVEVSSDGINYVRFPAVCNLQDTLQYDNAAVMDASKINNLAGKYGVNYGTPFDLQELSGNSLIDINSVTHLKIIDVVGSLNLAYARYDSNNHIINDPWPTPFNSSGFDLDAVGVINQKAVGINEAYLSSERVVIYPNPANNSIYFKNYGNCNECDFQITNCMGNVMLEGKLQGEIALSSLTSGVYFVSIISKDGKLTKKLVKQ